MRRRAFILGLGGAAAGWPLAARAQQRERMRRIGVLLPATASDSEYPTLVGAFLQELQQLGWALGRNLQMDIRWSGGNVDLLRKDAVELAGLAPDVIFAAGATATDPLLQATRTVPVVFTIVPDPVGAGFVSSLHRPGGNATGFTSFEYGIGGKWLELIKEIAPGVLRVGVIRDPAITAGIGQWSAIQTAAPAVGLEVRPINLRGGASETEQEVALFAPNASSGLIVTSSGLSVQHRDLLVGLAAKYRAPALYYARAFVDRGGLVAYGQDRIDQFRSAASYVDRILRGEKPADLPVQAPTKYELTINLKTAKAIGLNVPPTLLARADEVIE
ncbi:MAG TPA: ABC transporter substrate-binding protein [Xanthobacteraceae bacterium]|nr:ABC transporter substrate-binding protein [Xanthobacteraceae bacterium]